MLGRPESYFREPDETSWAERFGLPQDGSHVCDYNAFIQVVGAVASSDNGVLGARVMWGSLDRMVRGLQGPSRRSDLAILEHAFGPLRFAYLWREDILAQAVSWYRAETTGFWQQGDNEERPPTRDLDRMKEIVGTIREHNSAWRSWFDDHGVSPHVVTYEQLVQDNGATVEGIAALVGVTVRADWRPASPHRKQADDLNAEWAAALRTE